MESVDLSRAGRRVRTMAKETNGLKKELGFLSVYALATGATISDGFFFLPGNCLSRSGAGNDPELFHCRTSAHPGYLQHGRAVHRNAESGGHAKSERLDDVSIAIVVGSAHEEI